MPRNARDWLRNTDVLPSWTLATPSAAMAIAGMIKAARNPAKPGRQ